MRKGCYIYKYEVNDEVVYIGQTNDLERRVIQHATCKGIEAKFKDYADISSIWYFECENPTEMDVLEKILINQYKPVLNVRNNNAGIGIEIEDPEWILYREAKPKALHMKWKAKHSPYSNTIPKRNNSTNKASSDILTEALKGESLKYSRACYQITDNFASSIIIMLLSDIEGNPVLIGDLAKACAITYKQARVGIEKLHDYGLISKRSQNKTGFVFEDGHPKRLSMYYDLTDLGKQVCQKSA